MWRAIILVQSLFRSEQLCNNWILRCRRSTAKLKSVISLLFIITTKPSATLISDLFLSLVILSGEKHGEQAEHYAIFRPWYDKDPVDGEGHRAGQVHQNVSYCQDDGQRINSQSVARGYQAPRGEATLRISFHERKSRLCSWLVSLM